MKLPTTILPPSPGPPAELAGAVLRPSIIIGSPIQRCLDGCEREYKICVVACESRDARDSFWCKAGCKGSRLLCRLGCYD